MEALELANELKNLYDSLKGLPKGEPERLLDELDYANQWLARSSVLVAEAEKVLNTKRGEVASKHFLNNISATYLKEFLAQECSDEQRLYRLAERLNSTLSKRIESIRSALSYEKYLSSVGR